MVENFGNKKPASGRERVNQRHHANSTLQHPNNFAKRNPKFAWGFCVKIRMLEDDTDRSL